MTTFIIALFVLASIHYFYEGIYAPGVRMELRNRLFKLRDELRNHRIESDDIDVAAFEVASEAINLYINRLPFINIIFIAQMRKLANSDEAMTEEMQQRRNALLESKDDKIKDIVNRCADVLRDALICNSGGWFIYVIPFVLFGVFLQKIKKLLIGMFLAPANKIDSIKITPAKMA